MADTQSEQNRGLQQPQLQPDIGAGSQPTHLDLFSGIGGFALAAQWAGFRTIAFCEIEPYCQKVLAKNFGCVLADSERNGHVATTRQREVAEVEQRARRQEESQGVEQSTGSDTRSLLHRNIFDFDGTAYRGVSLITGGFPCQPFSVAGKRGGAADDRAIWPEMFRVINEARPAFVLGENVSGIIPMELDNVLSDLEGIGYATRTFVIPACAVDARHRRDRVWIIGKYLGNAERSKWRQNDEAAGCDKQRENGQGQAASRIRESGEAMANPNSSNGHGRTCDVQMGRKRCESEVAEDHNAAGIEWLAEPNVGRVAHGIPARVDRLKGLGNSIVPSVAYEILREIRKLI